MPSPHTDIVEAAARLRSGGVVAFPTETVYGLGADAFNAAAVERVYELKGRPSHNPLIVHISGPEMSQRVVAPGAWDERAARLSRAFWPGPLSIVLPKSPALPPIVTAGAQTVAVRCPDHPVTLALLFEFSGPLVGPSANVSGHVSPTRAEHVREAFSEEDVLVLGGGPCRGGIESTVIALGERGSPVRVLRPGLITPEDIERVLGDRVDMDKASARDGPLESPGRLPRHYSPRTPARLFEHKQWPEVLRRSPGQRTVVLSHRHLTLEPPHRFIPMPTDAESYAAALYSALREADALGVDAILIEHPPREGSLWGAIADRLGRATTPGK